jgi:biofilm PGA synthesis N-glycosyltransferase PgaC
MSLFLIGSDIYNTKDFFYRKSRKMELTPEELPNFTVIIPAHNEEGGVITCVESVLSSSYPTNKLDVVVMDDGSTDSTYKVLQEYKNNQKVDNLRIYTQKNGGKANALNSVLRKGVRGELVMCLDSDSSIHPDALYEAAQYFTDKKVVALAANVKVRPMNTILNFTQRIEYMMSYQFKRALTQYNIEYIIGGIGSVFRKRELEMVGHYDTDTMTEDIDLTMKLIRLGNKENRVIYGPKVIAYTDSVMSISGLIKQRFRWKYGRAQTFFKNKDVFFNTDKKYTKRLTFLYMPFIVFTDIAYIIEPLLMGYLLYISVLYKDPYTIIIAFLIMTTFVILNVLSEDTTKLSERVKLALLAPSMFVLFHIINFVEYVALIKSLLGVNKIRKRIDQGCTWTHVERPKSVMQS